MKRSKGFKTFSAVVSAPGAHTIFVDRITMAEAHQAVAFSFNVTRTGVSFYYDRDLLAEIWANYRRYWRYRLIRAANNVGNFVYPWNLRSFYFIAMVGIMWTLIRWRYERLSIPEPTGGITEWLILHVPRLQQLAQRSPAFSGIVPIVVVLVVYFIGWLLVVQLFRFTLSWLFTYRRPLYERSQVSLRTRVWFLLVRFCRLTNPRLYSMQGILPKLPLPSLDQTLARYLKTIRPLVDDVEYERVEQLGKRFVHGEGRKLQRWLLLKWWMSPNYVTDWWEKFVYLRSRTPLLVNSNFYIMDALRAERTKIQAARAANLIHALVKFRQLLEKELVKPLEIVGGMVPLCSAQYERVFDSTRIAGIDEDELRHWSHSSVYIVVLHRGRWFQLFTHYRGQPMMACELELTLQMIIDDPREPAPGERHLAALTATDRSEWARVRHKYFAHGPNGEALAIIERASFVCVLDDVDVGYDPNDPEPLDMYAKWLLCGDGSNRWCDKSFTLIVTRNGRIGFNVEHSWADAPVMGHVCEYACSEDLIEMGYDEQGHTIGEPRSGPAQLRPVRLFIRAGAELLEAIDKALAVSRSLVDDVDMRVDVFADFGKGFMKRCRVSPDAFIQMALQLAYYRDAGKFDLTYEASMTRLFLMGRTETVRPVSNESVTFVRSMSLDSPHTNGERKLLFRRACDLHQNAYLDCMCGKGIDRHLFALYVVSKFCDVTSPFLEAYVCCPWRLSTSQTPLSQTGRIDFLKYPECMSAGGGFGPVAEEGYGVSYIVGGENTVFFHISSKRSALRTDSSRFRTVLRQSLNDIRAVFRSDDSATDYRRQQHHNQTPPSSSNGAGQSSAIRETMSTLTDGDTYRQSASTTDSNGSRNSQMSKGTVRMREPTLARSSHVVGGGM